MNLTKKIDKKVFLFLCTALLGFSNHTLATQIYALNDSTPKKTIKKTVSTTSDTKPEFPGGKPAFMNFLKNHIVYPDSAKAHNIAGQVIASFFINADGSVSDIMILKGLGDGISEGVVQSLKAMPRWKPATHNGKSIRAQYKVPINFNAK